MTTDLAGLTFFPKPEAVPLSLAVAFLRMVMMHAAFEREVRSLQPHLFIVGAPYNADGSPGALANDASGFAAELERRFAIPVKRVDERW